MLESDIIAIFRDRGAIHKDGHYALSAEEHTSVYLDKTAVYADLEATASICRCIADWFMDWGIEVVVGPALGGIVLSQWVSHYMRNFERCPPNPLFAEKANDGTFFLGRQYSELVVDKRVLVVDDILTSGRSVQKVIDAVRACKGSVMGVGVVWNRGDVTSFPGVDRFYSLVSKKFPTWKKDICPLCIQKKIPVDLTLGHGAKSREKLWDF